MAPAPYLHNDNTYIWKVGLDGESLLQLRYRDDDTLSTCVRLTFGILGVLFRRYWPIHKYGRVMNYLCEDSVLCVWFRPCHIKDACESIFNSNICITACKQRIVGIGLDDTGAMKWLIILPYEGRQKWTIWSTRHQRCRLWSRFWEVNRFLCTNIYSCKLVGRQSFLWYGVELQMR